MKYSLPKEEVAVLLEFLAESRDHLNGIEEKVLKLEVSKDIEIINSIFRPIHTIKGSSSFLGLQNICSLSHQLESLLDDMRKGRVTAIDSDIIDILLEAIDLLSRMLQSTAVSVEAVDSSHLPLDIEIADIPYENLIERLLRVKTEKIATSVSENPGSETEKKRHAIRYDQIKYPGEMKLQYEVESGEQLVAVEKTLLELEKNPYNINLFNTLFRGLHSLKGNSGVILSVIDDEHIRRNHFINHFKEIAHLAESIVQKKRDTRGIFKENEVEILLQAADCLRNLLVHFKRNSEPDLTDCNILDQLKDLSSTAVEKIFDDTGNIKEIGGDSLSEAVSNNLNQGLDAIAAGLSEVTDSEKRETALKKLKRSYKNLTKIGKKIKHPFLLSKSTNGLNLVQFMLKGKDENETLFLENLTLELQELKEKADRRKAKRMDRRKTTLPPPPSTELESEFRPGDKVLKVSQDKIDTFMNLIGELLVSKNNLVTFEREVSIQYRLPEISERLKEAAETIARISDELQSTIMEIRMLPVAHAFSKFPRLIRDLCKKLNKKIRLEISGEETEIDKNIIESLTDPLVHMLRNSADHGIEPPEERTAAGKPAEGSIRLSAFNQGQHVIIRVTDDGRGMDPGQLRQKVLERSLLPPEELERMDHAQLLNLIFLPGFSMAGTVSDVSGRGVGMDVVKNNIEKLGGEVTIDSVKGKGSTVTIKLPLTMAIGRGLQVEAAGNRYYIPLESIIETLKISGDSIFKYKEREMTVIRDELIPIYRLTVQLGMHDCLDSSFPGRVNRKRESVVIVKVKGRKNGLLVDNYFHEHEYVIKPLTGGLADIDGISGAMITGEGKVHLILDLLRLLG